MILDIILVLIFLTFAILGMQKGLLASFIDIFRSMLSIVFSILLTPVSRNFLREHTSIYNTIFSKSSTSTFMPEILENKFLSPISDLILNTITFFILFIIFRVLLSLMTSFMSKRKKRGLIGYSDKLFGLLFGILKGAIIVCILMAVILPILDILGFNEVDAKTIIENSHIGNYIYNDNPLWKLSLLIGKL